VVTFAGGSISDPDAARRARTFLLDLLDKSRVDAVLSISNCVHQHLAPADGAAWLGRLGVPVTSIGVLPGVPSVCIEDSAGIAQLVNHLVAHHRHRRIAFITGTPTNPEAMARKVAYTDALAEHGIEADDRLILTGDFTRESGARAMVELFDARQVGVGDIQAVIASNDYMAFGAIDELSRRRIRVPDQVAVVGFDDMALARVYDPPLTTVRQPLETLGSDAAERLFAALDGQPPEPLVVLRTELVLRRSCGCVPTEIPPPIDAAVGGDRASAEMLVGLTAEMGGQRGAFARAVDPLLRRVAAGNARDLERHRRFADELAARLRGSGDDLVHDRVHRLATALELKMFGPQAGLSQTLATLLPDLGVDACAVAEIVEGSKTELRLAFGFDQHTGQPQMVTFPARSLVPETFEHMLERSVFVMPLKYGEEPLGVAVLPASARDGVFYETFSESLGVILKCLSVKRRLP